VWPDGFVLRSPSGPGPVAEFGSASTYPVKVQGIVRPTETREITVEAENYEAARAELEAQVPEGWQLLSLLITGR
jgi:hypothetical protein